MSIVLYVIFYSTFFLSYFYVKQIIQIMAIEKEKVITRYKSLFGSVGLSQTRLDEISAKLALKMADEATDEDIDARLNEQNDIYPFAEIKKHDDRILNEKNNPNKKPSTDDTKKAEPAKADVPEWAQSLITEIQELKSAKQKESIETKFRKDERLKGVPEFVIKRSIPASEDDYETVVSELQSEFKTFAEKNKLAAFGNDTPPNGTPKKPGEVKVKTAEELKDLAAQI